MRRRTVFLVAAGYALSFLVVCLGTCFAAAPVAEHACCQGKDGFRAVARDCCLVTPGASTDGPSIAHASPYRALVADRLVSDPPIAAWAPPATLAASPPLVLRI